MPTYLAIIIESWYFIFHSLIQYNRKENKILWEIISDIIITKTKRDMLQIRFKLLPRLSWVWFLHQDQLYNIANYQIIILIMIILIIRPKKNLIVVVQFLFLHFSNARGAAKLKIHSLIYTFQEYHLKRKENWTKKKLIVGKLRMFHWNKLKILENEIDILKI